MWCVLLCNCLLFYYIHYIAQTHGSSRKRFNNSLMGKAHTSHLQRPLSKKHISFVIGCVWIIYYVSLLFILYKIFSYYWKSVRFACAICEKIWELIFEWLIKLKELYCAFFYYETENNIFKRCRHSLVCSDKKINKNNNKWINIWIVKLIDF